MGKINLLPKSVYNMISAGEVVERPSSVVKELFENSVDAGATEITVGISDDCKEIYVLDNGCGMEKDDILKSIYPHATSKILKAEDLESIMTLGFRGEALASIAAVSKLRLSSKTKENEIGYSLTAEGGSVIDLTESPCLDGTCVTVEDLFFNTPARKKFLKAPKSEENEVTDTVEKLILANPDIIVKYLIDDRLVLQSYGGGATDAALAVYGAETVEKCYLISDEHHGITVKGYIGNTNFYKSNRSYQTIIVNGRVVEDSTISTAMKNAYGNYMMKRQFPFYILYITVPPEILDVNVHPRKAEVRFSDNRIIYGAVYSTVTNVLDGSAQALNIVITPPKSQQLNFESKLGEPVKEDVLAAVKPKDSFDIPRNADNKPYFLTEDASYIKRPKINDEDIEYDKSPDRVKVSKPKVSDVPPVRDFTDIKKNSIIDDIFKENKEYVEKLEREKLEKEKRESEQLSIETDAAVRYVGQVLKTYLVLECGSDMILIDQHAAHERFLYDLFYEKVKTNCVVKQSLLYPYAFKTSAKEFELLYDQMQYFRKLGIDLEVADDNLFKVYSVPVELSDMNYDEFFADVLSDESYKKETLPGVLTEKLMQKACKSAIKSGYELSRMEIDSLLSLLKQDWGLKCPHGRPVAVKISRTEIDKWFKRIV